jgi:hypothetical protein
MNVKVLVTAILVCVGIASLGGCASMGMGKGDARDLNSAIADDPIDEAYVAQVNTEANRHFAQIIWVNPPYKDQSQVKQNR